jgi:prefoldin subunit 5
MSSQLIVLVRQHFYIAERQEVAVKDIEKRWEKINDP